MWYNFRIHHHTLIKFKFNDQIRKKLSSSWTNVNKKSSRTKIRNVTKFRD